MSRQRANFADYLFNRNFDRNSVLRFCRFPKIASLEISTTPIVKYKLYSFDDNPVFSGVSENVLLRELNKRYLRLYLSFTETDEFKFNQLKVWIRIANKTQNAIFQKTNYTQNIQLSGNRYLLFYDLTMNAGDKAPKYLQALPIVDDLLQ